MYNRNRLKEKADRAKDKQGAIGPDINLDEFDEAPVPHSYLADEDLCDLPQEEKKRPRGVRVLVLGLIPHATASHFGIRDGLVDLVGNHVELVTR